MKIPALLLSAALFSSLPFGGAPGISPASAAVDAKVQDAVTRGLDYLTKKQNAAGFWSSGEYPGLTALVVQAYIMAPGGEHKKDEAVTKGLEFIRKQAKPDGSIHAGRMSIYNTSICLAALVRNGDGKDRVLMDGAQNFLVSGQTKNPPGKRGTAVMVMTRRARARRPAPIWTTLSSRSKPSSCTAICRRMRTSRRASSSTGVRRLIL